MRRAVAYLRYPGALALDATLLPRDVALVATVADPDREERSQLARALEPIESGEADTLLLARLGSAARSAPELLDLLDWLERAGASLLALDLGFDTATAAGAQAIVLLREVEGWRRARERPGPGRPGLAAGAPHLARRIAELRERGLSLHAIAERLNQEGVPTVRGGARWRASSVQAALGYRRPRPPAPGMPPGSPPPPPKPPEPSKPAPPHRRRGRP